MPMFLTPHIEFPPWDFGALSLFGADAMTVCALGPGFLLLLHLTLLSYLLSVWQKFVEICYLLMSSISLSLSIWFT